MKSAIATLVLLLLGIASAVDVGNIPACAQICLQNSTTNQTSCAVVDIACLCTNQAYVTTLSCCLATTCNSSEQAIAIQFNQQECIAVNLTAPNFVGCSPSGLSIASGNGATATLTSSTTTTMSTSVNTLISVVSGSVLSELATHSGPKATATFDGHPLMTGSCTSQFFAMITDAQGLMTEFPAVGCGPGRSDCCPFGYGANGDVSECPQDYFTTAGSCCPLGMQLYYTNIGAYTPCYSSLSVTLVPAETPTDAAIALITNQIFADAFPLAQSGGKKGLPTGALIGIIINVVLFVAIFIAIIWYRKRKIRRIAEANRATTFPPMEPTMSMAETRSGRTPSTHELASPEMQATTPRSLSNNWPMNSQSPPPTYEIGRPKPISTKVDKPQELPGSTFLHEHHPAFASETASTEEIPPLSASPPMTPVRSTTRSIGGSPPVTPSSSVPDGTQRSPFVSPLNSPGMPQR